jgi:pyruvate dehydrogenase phosphatase
MKETKMGPRLASPPIKKVKFSQKSKPLQEIEVPDLSEKDNEESHKEEGNETKAASDPSTENNVAPLGKLASKMKSMLRRKNTNDKRKEKKEKDYYDPAEVVHWTEM